MDKKLTMKIDGFCVFREIYDFFNRDCLAIHSREQLCITFFAAEVKTPK